MLDICLLFITDFNGANNSVFDNDIHFKDSPMKDVIFKM